MSKPTPIVSAATILMVRDAPSLEVLMIERHRQIEFVGGALVFPGGKVGREDYDPAWRDLIDGAGDDDVEIGLQIAAIREAYEEAGILLARPRKRRGAGEPLLHPDEAPGLFHAPVGEAPEGVFLAMMRDAELVLALDALTRFANWLSPDVPHIMPKRFDTYFFLAPTPPDQAAVHDGQEAVDSCWINPGQALEDAAAGRRMIVFPTRMNLEMLGRSESVGEAVRSAQARPRYKVEPRIVVRDGVEWVHLPPEAGYAVAFEQVER